MTNNEAKKTDAEAAKEYAAQAYPYSSMPLSTIHNKTCFKILNAARLQIEEAFLDGCQHKDAELRDAKIEAARRALTLGIIFADKFPTMDLAMEQFTKELDNE